MQTWLRKRRWGWHVATALTLITGLLWGWLPLLIGVFRGKTCAWLAWLYWQAWYWPGVCDPHGWDLPRPYEYEEATR